MAHIAYFLVWSNRMEGGSRNYFGVNHSERRDKQIEGRIRLMRFHPKIWLKKCSRRSKIVPFKRIFLFGVIIIGSMISFKEKHSKSERTESNKFPNERQNTNINERIFAKFVPFSAPLQHQSFSQIPLSLLSLTKHEDFLSFRESKESFH